MYLGIPQGTSLSNQRTSMHNALLVYWTINSPKYCLVQNIPFIFASSKRHNSRMLGFKSYYHALIGNDRGRTPRRTQCSHLLIFIDRKLLRLKIRTSIVRFLSFYGLHCKILILFIFAYSLEYEMDHLILIAWTWIAGRSKYTRILPLIPSLLHAIQCKTVRWIQTVIGHGGLDDFVLTVLMLCAWGWYG